MKVIDFEWLADENIHPEWIRICRLKTKVHTLAEVGLLGKSDSEIMSFSFERKYLIFTQDSDFGHLSIANKQPFIGIVFLRPGHLNPLVHLQTIQHILNQAIEVFPPFILVASNANNTIRVRVRNHI